MRIAAYCRVSTESERQLESLENQKAFFEDFAGRSGHTLIRIYADEGISGRQIKRREQFNQMLADAGKDLFDMVVVKDISRFARNTVDFLTAVRSLKAQGIEVLFVSNNQTILGDSEFILTIFSALAQEESASLSKRVKFGKKVNAKKGRVPNVIFGYDRVDNFTLAVNPAEAEAVRQVFDLYTNAGYGVRRIASVLSEGGTPSKTGGVWGAKTVRRLLENPVYMGVLVNNKSETVDFLTGKRKNLPEAERFVHERLALAIIPPGLFAETQRQLAQRRAAYGGSQTRHTAAHTYSALIRCGECGNAFYRKTTTYKNTFHRWRCGGNNAHGKGFCRNSIAIDEAELTAQINAYLHAAFSDSADFAVRLRAALAGEGGAEGGGAQAREGQLRRLDAVRERYKILFANGFIGMGELTKKCKEIDSAKERLQSEILPDSAAEEEGGKLDVSQLTNADMRRLIDRIVAMPDGEVCIYFR